MYRTDRLIGKDTKIGEIDVPQGMLIIIPIYTIHHDPKIWPEPEKFNPYRFTPEEKAKHGPYDWIPFGGGQRSCIAMRLALLEVKVAVAHLVRKYKFVRSIKTEVSDISLNYQKRSLYFLAHYVLVLSSGVKYRLDPPPCMIAPLPYMGMHPVNFS